MEMERLFIHMKSNKFKYTLILLCIINIALASIYLLKTNIFNKIDDRFEKIGYEYAAYLEIPGTSIDNSINWYYEYAAQGADITDNMLFFVEEDAMLLSDNNVVLGKIGGHNIKNVSSNPLIADESHERFEQLLSFTDLDFSQENQMFYYTADTTMEFSIFAAGYVPIEFAGMNLNVTKESLSELINQMRDYSFYDYDIDVDENDKIMMLITCTRAYGSDADVVYGVFGRLKRVEEENESVLLSINDDRKEIE